MADDAFLAIFLEESEELLIQWEEACMQLDTGYSEEDLNGLFRAIHTLKGSSKAVGLDAFGGFIHQVEDLIKLLQEGRIEAGRVVNPLLDWQRIAADWLQAVKTGQTYRFAEEAFVEAIKQLQSSGEAMASPQTMMRPETVAKKSNESSKDDTIRVSAVKCDKLLRSVGQITINCVALRRQLASGQAAEETLGQYLDALEKHADRLHKDTLAIRMQPLDRFFLRMQRLAKDVSQQTAKPIQVVTEGSHVEIDKSVADRLIDPFVHIVRNAIDHGIEPESDRLRKGKPKQGQLFLRARSLSSGLEISVADDGKGLDPQVIRKKAVEKKLVGADEALTTEQINRLILKPGFSTKEMVSDLSGRGVGMDVVASTVEKLGGKTDIDSECGKGTTIRLFLPANLTILNAFIVASGADRFCVLIQEVEEIIDLKQMGTRFVEGTEMVDLRGSPIPVTLFSQLSRDRSDAARRPALVGCAGEQRLAFEVDRILRKQKIMVSDNDHAKSIDGFAGVAIMDDFQPGMILSLNHLIESHNKQLEAAV